MALNAEFIAEHIVNWQGQLTSPFYPHRKHWPTRLFHHAPLENALAILREGVLRSRNDALNTHPRDVAASGVIDARCDAHERVRLYFRPKTPTQFHIEGIQKDSECAYPGAHAPILVMFALDAATVLAQPDIMFSNQNMQIGSTIAGSDAAYFRTIPFEKVFHEGNTGGDRTITNARAAEVLPSSPLNLRFCLKEVYFRSEPERETLLYELGEHRVAWQQICHVSDALKVFEKRHTFVQDIGLTPEGVLFKFNPRSDRRNISVVIKVWDTLNRLVIDFFNDDLAAQPPQAARWIWKHPLVDGLYLVEVHLDGHLAYRCTIPLNSVLF